MPLIPSVPETGNQLRAWRRYHGHTQAAAAASLGVSASTISRWERTDARLPEAVRDLFPNPPVLTLTTDRPAREPTHVELAFGASAAQQAVEFQARYAKTIQDALAAMTKTVDFTAIRRSLDALTFNIAPLIEAFQARPFQQTLSNYRAMSEQLAASFDRSFRPILEQATRAFQDIVAAFPTEEEFRRVGGILADRGWFIGLQFPIGIIRQVDTRLAEADHDGVEALMQDYVRASLPDILVDAEQRCPARSSILRGAAAAHDEGRFELSVPVLLAQADGIAWDILGGHLFISWRAERKQPKRTLASVKFEAKASELGIAIDHGWLTVALAPVYDGASIAVHTDIRARRRADDPLYGPLNRHGVLHGLDTDYATEGNSLRAFLLLEFLLSLEAVLADK